MKKLLKIVLCVLPFGTCFAGLTYDITLVPERPEVLSNPFVWASNFECSIETPEETIAFKVKLTSGKGVVDGEIFEQGDERKFIAHNGSKYFITAEKLSSVEIEKVAVDNDTANDEVAYAHCVMK